MRLKTTDARAGVISASIIASSRSLSSGLQLVLERVFIASTVLLPANTFALMQIIAFVSQRRRLICGVIVAHPLAKPLRHFALACDQQLCIEFGLAGHLEGQERANDQTLAGGAAAPDDELVGATRGSGAGFKDAERLR